LPGLVEARSARFCGSLLVLAWLILKQAVEAGLMRETGERLSSVEGFLFLPPQLSMEPQ
jgi:hypothetical protein